MSEQVKQDASVDLRAYHPLARLRRIIRAYVLLEGLFLAIILACSWFWFSTALDFGLQYFFGVDMLDDQSTRPLRWLLVVLFGVGMAVVLVWYIVRRWFRTFSPASLALVLEKRFPELLWDPLESTCRHASLSIL